MSFDFYVLSEYRIVIIKTNRIVFCDLVVEAFGEKSGH